MKLRNVLLIAAVILAGCGNANKAAVQKNAAGTAAVNLAQTAPGIVQTSPDTKTVPETVEIKEKMFIAQTNDVYLNAEDYLGKTISLEGLFKAVQYEGVDAPYCFVLRYGPGCCGSDGNAGFEVAWDEAHEALPQEADWVAATGVLSAYEENGFQYLYIKLSALEVKEERGAEFVSQ